MGFMDKLKEQVKEMANEEQEKQQAEQDRKAELDKEGKAYCPKCKSTDLSANKKGYSLATGLIGMNKVKITCLKCGNKFKPGK